MRRLLLLVLELRCPKCNRPWRGAYVHSAVMLPKCWHERCLQRWWTMTFEPGPVLPQLADAFGEELAPVLAREYGFPETLAEPRYWQLPLTGNQFERHGKKPAREMFEAFDLVERPGGRRLPAA